MSAEYDGLLLVVEDLDREFLATLARSSKVLGSSPAQTNIQRYRLVKHIDAQQECVVYNLSPIV